MFFSGWDMNMNTKGWGGVVMILSMEGIFQYTRKRYSTCVT